MMHDDKIYQKLSFMVDIGASECHHQAKAQGMYDLKKLKVTPSMTEDNGVFCVLGGRNEYEYCGTNSLVITKTYIPLQYLAYYCGVLNTQIALDYYKPKIFTADEIPHMKNKIDNFENQSKRDELIAKINKDLQNLQEQIRKLRNEPS